MKDGKTLVLGIETSCDETAAAVVADGREIISNVIASQIDVHRVFGGVVPEIASRHHLIAVNEIAAEAMGEISPAEIDAVAVTEGPGLVGAVLIGIATAKSYAYAWGKPLVGVHHIRGHICAALLETKELEPPFLSLVVSGGHTSIVDVAGIGEMTVIGSTRDDAAGEAYDKVAHVLGLGYPGGPLVDELARSGDPDAIAFKRVMLEAGSLDFSFSGIKTGVMNFMNTERQAGREPNAADVAAGFQQSVIDVLTAKTMMALERTGRKNLTVCGGVAANSALRARMKKACEEKGIGLYIPSPILCTDNAAMIASAGYFAFEAGERADLYLDAHAALELD
ncbi:MAG: tRNA (adenosine(37)-N6)-threonylcarbamoyltransferase complex transferase subunit TsaD [Clostridiales Family XIII bacterium]|jgi:N6-L-threonylcarbamoyladenine synthase|nr:tRNA (adenosine(37)-N6)-threonylcarbamoyltransferase complex transferase subunit TsaD [Clostridiales Family XIII bacterium]